MWLADRGEVARERSDKGYKSHLVNAQTGGARDSKLH
jgi:hypothetical protein